MDGTVAPECVRCSFYESICGLPQHTPTPHVADASTDYVHFMCPYENEDKLPSLFHYLKVSFWGWNGLSYTDSMYTDARTGFVSILLLLMGALQSHKHELGVIDLQVRQTPLEDVFLVVTRKAELEYAQVKWAGRALSAIHRLSYVPVI